MTLIRILLDVLVMNASRTCGIPAEIRERSLLLQIIYS